MKSITLYCREGGSDKVYSISPVEVAGGWLIHIAYGRRGTTLTSRTKTPEPVSHEKAVKIYDQLVRSKTSKGYTTGPEATAYSGGESKPTDIRPQLLNPVDEADLSTLLADDLFVLQPKLDGRRLLIRKRGNEVIGINRRGLECGMPETVRLAALALDGDFLLDGEAVGDVFTAFDLLDLGEEDFRNHPYHRRRIEMMSLVRESIQGHIRHICSFHGQQEKRDAFARYRKQNAEGVVFKHELAPSVAGRPATGGDQLKFKFVETASVVVSAINAKRSVAISVWNDTTLVSAGNVTIPPNHDVPEVGQVAEVRYLYAMPNTGHLCQPVYRGVRDDIEPAECVATNSSSKPTEFSPHPNHTPT